MGAAVSVLQDDQQLTAEEVKTLLEDKFDEGKFAAAAGDKSYITGAQLKEMLPPSEQPYVPDSDEEEEEDIGDGPEFVEPPPMAKKGRKTGVSAESMDPSKMAEQMKNITCIEKSPEVTENLLKVVAKSPLLRTLDDEQKDKIVKAFSGPVVKQPGEDVIVQGENGETFYLIEDGEVDVYVAKGGGDPIKVHTYTPGNSFGELAIMYNAPRAATCRAKDEVKLWALDRVSFKCIVVAAAMQKREQYKGFLQAVPILASLNEMEIMTLADSLAEEKFSDGSTIFSEGDEGNFFYIVKEGVVLITKKDEGGEDKEVLRCQEGQYFGEIALLSDKPRQATVKASGDTKVLSLDRATFVRVMGPLDDIMKRNMEAYEKFNASNNL